MLYLGESFALATALCWTASGTAFAVASRAVGPLAANQFRLVTALPVLLVLAWCVAGQWWPAHASGERIVLIALSGLVGLVLGDIGFFHALATIGPRLSSVVMALWPAFTVAIEAAGGHRPDRIVLLGIGLTTVGVTMVLLRGREGSAWRPGRTRGQWLLGIGGAVLGALGQAGGFLLAGHGMAPGDDLPDGVDPLLATLVRMAAAVAGLQVFAFVQRRPLAMRAVAVDRRALRAALLGALFGPILGVWLSMLARRHAADAGVAAALMATTPVFMMPVAAVLYRARIGVLGITGTLLAVAGAGVAVAAVAR